MKNQLFERMQKIAFGKIVLEADQTPLTESTLRDKIKELVYASLNEAKKKKKDAEDVAPQEDVPAEPAADATAPTTDATAPTTDATAPTADAATDIDPTVKSIQDSLQKAFAQAKSLGDEKLVAQIGNTITMLVRTQVLGVKQGVAENMDGNDDTVSKALAHIKDEINTFDEHWNSGTIKGQSRASVAANSIVKYANELKNQVSSNSSSAEERGRKFAAGK